MPKNTKVLIVGAGAMGCLFAARMAGSGLDVTLVDVDRDRLALIAADGLMLEDDTGDHEVFPRTALVAEFSGPVDLILLFTKGTHSPAAVASIAHLAANSPLVLTLQNGVGNAEIIAEAFAPDRIVMGTAHVSASLARPNRVVTHGFAHVDIGGFERAADRHAPEIADLLRRAGFATAVSTNVHATVWEKLAFNAALNALAMIVHASNRMLDNAHGRAVAHRVVTETVHVAAAKGIVLSEPEILATVNRALSEHGHHKASMLQDREAGRATEIEFINGAVAREGARLGVETPANEILTSIVHLIEAKAVA
jgi:2-dehydropantoate 2-reductase